MNLNSPLIYKPMQCGPASLKACLYRNSDILLSPPKMMQSDLYICALYLFGSFLLLLTVGNRFEKQVQTACAKRATVFRGGRREM